MLRARDYGGFTTVRATAGGQQVEFRVPRDENNNWLPDGGWWSWAGPDHVPDTFGQCASAAQCDRDYLPTGVPPAGRLGDGFTNFEEFRGFIVRGEHRRTDPRHKDVFFSSTVEAHGVYLGIAYAYPELPTATHRVWAAGQGSGPEYPASRVINGNYENSGHGGNIVGHEEQPAVRIVVGTAPPGPNWYGCTLETPADCASQPPWGGSAVPSQVDRLEVYVDNIVAATTALGWLVDRQLAQVRKTIGHEAGHAVGKCHRPLDVCHYNPGTALSLMTSGLTGPDPNTPGAQYNPVDQNHLRLHDRVYPD